MNNWQAIGGIFCCIGIVLLIVGFVTGVNAANVFDQTIIGQYITPQEKGMLFWKEAQIYLVSGALAFIVGSVGLYAGRNVNKNVIETPSSSTIRVETSSPTLMNNEANKAVFPNSKIVCGSCGTMNDMDASYCKKCANRFR